MEFKLNKIDIELRQKINEETKEGKVHANKGISINQNDNEERQKQRRGKKEEKDKINLSKYGSKDKKITIEAVKKKDISIDAQKLESTSNTLEYKGRFLDIRR